MNESARNCISADSPQVDFFFMVINTIFCAFGLATNLFVAITFCKNRIVLKVPSNRLVFSLLVSDTLSSVNVLAQITISLKFKHVVVVRLFNDIITAFLAQNAVLHLCGITLDRFISLYFALRYKEILTLKFITRYIQLAWGLSFIASSIQFLWVYKDLSGKRSGEEIIKTINIEKWYSLVIFLFFLLLPMLFLGLALTAMFYEIRKILLKTKCLMVEKPLSVTAQQRRVLYMFACMYVCFSMFAMPYFTIRMLEDFQVWCSSQLTLQIVFTLKTAPSFANSILYSFFNKEMKNNLKFSFNKVITFCSKNKNFKKSNSFILLHVNGVRT